MSSKKERSKHLLIFLISLGILVAIFGIYFYLSDNDSKNILPTITEPTELQPLHSRKNPTRLIIPALKLDLPVSEGLIIDGVWQLNRYDVSHLNISANPGENGNIVIYGHNLKVIFGSLPYINIDAIIKVITEDGKEHTYKVYSKKNC